jgi:hypothetical protein
MIEMIVPNAGINQVINIYKPSLMVVKLAKAHAMRDTQGMEIFYLTDALSVMKNV